MAYYEYCPEHNGIEIYFDDRPDEEYLSDLRDNGWRWHRYKKCWYNFQSDENEEFAEEICDTYNGEYGYDCNDEEDDEEDYAPSITSSALNGNLIKCVDCGKNISSRATYCVGCGAPMDYIKAEYEKERIRKQRIEEQKIKEKAAKEKAIREREAELRKKAEQEERERKQRSPYDHMNIYEIQRLVDARLEKERGELIRNTINNAQRGKYGQELKIGEDGFVMVGNDKKFWVE